MSEKIITACREILNTRYRWIGFGILIFWVVTIWLWVKFFGVGIYFSIFIGIMFLNSFFTLKTCDTPKEILKKVYPILIPVLGFIIIVIVVNPSSLQLLSGLDPAEIESVNININDVVANSWLLAFSSLGGGAPNIIWEAAFLPMYIVGFLVYAWSDASDRDGLKGLATIVILAPIAIQFILGFTYGKSYGLLGRIGAMGTALEQLGGAASVVAVLVGSILDFVLVSVFFGVEHMIPEEEEL